MSEQVPPLTPLPYATPPQGDPSVLKVGLAQRRIMWAILGAILLGVTFVVGTVASPNPGISQDITLLFFYVVRLGLIVFMMVCIYQMAAALGSSKFSCILLAIGMLLPLIGLIILLVVNQWATKFLKAKGVKVGFMGARLADLQST